MENCYENLDERLNDYRIKVHAMKSSLALIGIGTLSEEARKLEMAAKDLDKDYIKENTAKFLCDFRGYKEELSVLINEEEKEEFFDKTVIEEKLIRLKEAMDMMDIDMADEIVKELRRYRYSEEIEVKMEELVATVVNLDGMTAGDIVDEILELI